MLGRYLRVLVYSRTTTSIATTVSTLLLILILYRCHNALQTKRHLSLGGMMSAGCSFHCRHPLWGGDGICIADDSDPTADAACSCGAGFSSRDGAGYPSCVPKVALVAGYTILAVSGLLTAAFLLLHVNRHRYLPPQHRSTRRAVFQIRALVSSRWVGA